MVFNISELDIFSSSGRNEIRSIGIHYSFFKKRQVNWTVKVDKVLMY